MRTKMRKARKANDIAAPVHNTAYNKMIRQNYQLEDSRLHTINVRESILVTFGARVAMVKKQAMLIRGHMLQNGS